jgi:hypothetical protein
MQATSGDAGLLARLASGEFSARVHSVFTRVVNIESSSGTLYTLACTHVDNAPATLVVDTRSFDRFALAPGTRTRCSGTTLRPGPSLEISFAQAAPWSSALSDWPRKGMPVRWLRALIERHGASGGVKPAPRPDGRFERELAHMLSHTTRSLESALAGSDVGAVHAHGKRLIGLGPGLTPAGDDYLVGLATVCNLPGSPVRDLRPVLMTLVDDNRERTNDISYAAMAHATRGRVRESITELVAAMARSDRWAMERRGRQVIGIGATSGTDILAGMLAGLELAQIGKG